MAIDVPDILKRIIKRKYEEVEERSALVSLEQLVDRASHADAVRGFCNAMDAKIANGHAAVIAAKVCYAILSNLRSLLEAMKPVELPVCQY
jgi:indole-3-glycerol phosphate synthase